MIGREYAEGSDVRKKTLKPVVFSFSCFVVFCGFFKIDLDMWTIII